MTDRLWSYRAAMNVIGNGADHECGCWLNNRAEISHQQFRRRERAMSTFEEHFGGNPVAILAGTVDGTSRKPQKLCRAPLAQSDRAAAF